ncbi:rRNA maturation RNase YbeY [Pseudothermotoga sp.]|uniref:rRNA maturation RNase YbeY n=1 Tax=Pseudothermotoga sp. TaxID=2033661 RepID=UPI0031F66656
MQNRTRRKLSIKRIRAILREIIKKEIGDVTVDIFFIGEKTMAKLNQTFRKIKGPTDVLTFVYKEELYGEIFICPTIVEKNATRFDCSFEEELLRTVIHAALHLAGFDHELDEKGSEEMFRKQEEYLREVERHDR